MAWWKRKPKTVPVVAPPPERAGGFFSTAALRLRMPGESLAGFAAALDAQVFKRTHDDIKRAQPSVAANGRIAFATDSYEWSGGNNIKGIYTLQGYGISDALAAWYASQGFIGYQMCAVISQNWLVDKACTMPARDATRNGYEITVNDGTEVPPEVFDYMKKLDKRFQVQMNCREAIRHNRIYGIRIVLFEVQSTDPDYYEKPFNPDGVAPGSYMGMSQVDPYWITPELDFNAAANPASKHFYEPTYWRINGRRYHRSHLVVIKTCDVPDVLKPTYFYGGIPLPQRIAERIYAAERTANEAPQLALSKRSTVIHVDIEKAVANQAQFTDRMTWWAYIRDNFGIKVVGQEEKIEQFDTALADMDETIMTQYQLVCAIAEVPATKLLGTTPKGFNATGEYEEASYHEMLESLQEHEARPIVERHHLLCMRSYVAPKFGIKPFETTVVFNDLDAETSAEKAKRQLDQANAYKSLAETGAIDGVDIRAMLIADEDSGMNGLPTVEPAGPQPKSVVDPGATIKAPNDPTTAEANASLASGGGGSS